MAYIFPITFILIFVFALIKKVKPYDEFVSGAKGAIPFIINLFPYLSAIFILTELFERSGLADTVTTVTQPLLTVLGIPKEVNKLILIKPFSGSGSLAMLNKIFTDYGVDSYISRVASCIYGSSETVFYVSSVYFLNSKTKNLFAPILISLVASFSSFIIASFICHVM